MAFFGVEDALRTARESLDNQGAPRPTGPGLLPPPPPPQDPQPIELWNDYLRKSGNGRLVAGVKPPPKPFQSKPSESIDLRLKGQREVLQIWEKAKADVERKDREEAAKRAPKSKSPLHDRERATPGTLERNMALLDQKFGKDPRYKRVRDAIKYRLQDAMQNRPASGNSPILKAEAVTYARNVMGELKDPSYYGTAVKPGTQGVAGMPKADPQPEGENFWEALARFDAERDDLSKAPTSTFDRVVQAARTIKTPDYSDKIGPDAGGFVQGVMGNFNPAEALAGFVDLGELLGDVSQPITVERVLGPTPAEQRKGLFRLAGGVAAGLAGGKLATINRANKAGALPEVPLPVQVASVADEVAEAAPPVVAAPRGPDVPTAAPTRRGLLNEAIQENLAAERAENPVTPPVEQAKPRPRPQAGQQAPTEPVTLGPGQFGDMANAIGENLIDRLYERYAAGHTTEADSFTRKSNVLVAADAIRTMTGKALSRDQFASFAREFAGAKDARQARAVVDKYSAQPVTVPGPESSTVSGIIPDTPVNTQPLTRRPRGVEPGANAGQASATVEPAVPDTSVAYQKTPARDFSQMTAEDIWKAVDDTKAADDALLVEIFGPDGASRYKRLLAEEGSYNSAKANAASDARDVMESGLSPAQRERLFRTADENYLAPEKIREFANKAVEIDEARNAAELGSAISVALKDARRGGSIDPYSLFQIERAQRRAAQLGIDPSTVVDAAITRRAMFDGADAAELLDMSQGDVAGATQRFLRSQTPDMTAPAIEGQLTPEPGSPRGLEFNPERGATDVKTLAKIAAVGGVGLGGYALLTNGGAQAISEYLKEHGLPREAVIGLGAAGAVGATLYGINRGGFSPSTFFEGASAVYDPVGLAKKALSGDTKASRLFGEAALTITDAYRRHQLASTTSLRDLGLILRDEFGKAWNKNEEFAQIDTTVRDKMEQNIDQGLSWNEGLTPKEISFVSRVRSQILDPILDQWESLGGRVWVKNDGTQQTKLAPGARVKLADGREATFVEATPYTPGTGTRPGRPGAVNDLADEIRNARTTSGNPASTDPLPPGTDPFEVTGSGDANRAARRPRGGDEGFDEKYSLVVQADDGTTLTIQPGESFGRPVFRLGDAFVPRIYSKEFVARLRGKRTKEFNLALEKMLDEQNPGGVKGDEMVGKLVDIANAAENADRNVANYMANLEKERQVNLAKFEYTDAQGRTVVVDPYESSYTASAAAYVDRGWKRVAIAEQLGTDPSAIGAMLRAVKTSNAQYGSYLETLIGRALGLGDEVPKASKAANAARAEGAYQTLTKLTGGTTVIAQLSDVVLPFTEAGPRRFAEGAFRILTSRAAREEAALLAAVDDTWMSDLRGDGGFARANQGAFGKIGTGAAQFLTKPGERIDGLSRMTDGIMTAIGLRAMDRTTKLVAASVSTTDAMDALARVAAARRKGSVPKGVDLRKVERYGLTDYIDDAVANGAEAVMDDPKAQASFAGSIQRTLMYTGSAIDNPLWMSSPAGQVVTRFKKPLYLTTRFIMQNVLEEAMNGNYAPMARFMVAGIGMGTASTYLKDLVRNGADQEARDLIAKGDFAGGLKRIFGEAGKSTLTNPINRKTLTQILYTAGKNMYDAGSLGVPGEFISSYNRRVQDITGNPTPRMMRALAPVSYDSLENFATRILGKKSDIADENWQQWRASVQEAIEGEVLPLRRLSGFLGTEAPLTQLEKIQKKIARNEPITRAEFKFLGTQGYKLKGRFEELRTIKKGDTGPTYSDAVYETLGLNKDLSIRQSP